jgi:hypothetical protein
MRVEPQPTAVRRIVIATFQRLGASPRSLFDMEEHIGLDEGEYASRTYAVSDLMAIWLVEIGIVQFYDAEGNMLVTVNLFRELTPQRAAA